MKIKIPYFGCLALVMLIMLSPIVTLAQGNSIRGKVQDEQGNAISGATIKIKGTKATVPSAADGTFEITNFTISEIILQVSFLGYQTKEQRASLGQIVTITLYPSSNKMDEVFVTGTFDKRKRMDASVAISTLDAAQIEKLVPSSAADLLKNVPGVFVNSSLGEIRNSVASRGITVGTQDGSFGYEYVSMQEDGLPITNSTYFNYGPDFFLRPDATLYRLEAVRGGTASITAANAPGGIFNYVSKTGGDVLAGEIRLKYGLLSPDGHSFSRADFNIGGPIQNNWFYNIGGFYRYDQSGRYPGYAMNNGGQVKGNIMKKYSKGTLKIFLKYLNDKNGYVQFIPTNSYDKPEPAPGFNIYSSVLMPALNYESQDFMYGGTMSFNPKNLVHSTYRSAGFNWEHQLGNNWTFNNAARYAKNNILYNTPGNVTTMSATDLTSYFLLSGMEGLGIGMYSYKNAKTGEELMQVASALGQGGLPTYTAVSNKLPGQDLFQNGVFMTTFGAYHNDVKEFIDQFTFQKTTDNMSFAMGGYFGHTDVERYSGVDGVAISTIENRPQYLTLDFTGGTLAGTTGVHKVTNSDGIAQAIGDNGASLTFNATQRLMALFFGHTWNINPNLTFDWGIRYENMKVKGHNERVYMKTGVQGGLDGDPKTFYDNNTVDRITSVNFDKTLNSFSFSGALNYKFNENMALYGRYSQGKKAPDLDVYFAANREETIGLLNPQERTTRQVELGLKARTKDLNLFVTPFYSVLSGVPSGQFFQAEGGGFYVPETLYGKYSTVGVEIEADWQLHRNFSVRGIATVQRSKIINLEQWVANNPGLADDTKVSYSGNETDNNARIIMNITPTYTTGKFYSFITWSHLGKRQANVVNTFTLPSFSQFDLGAGYDVSKKIKLSLNINNLFNKYAVMSWVRPGGILETLAGNNSFTKEEYDQAVQNNTPYSTVSNPPRSYYLTATYKF
jgi:iron complex outermembrane receptor protein